MAAVEIEYNWGVSKKYRFESFCYGPKSCKLYTKISGPAGGSRSGSDCSAAHRQFACCRWPDTVRCPGECGDGNGGHGLPLCIPCAHSCPCRIRQSGCACLSRVMSAGRPSVEEFLPFMSINAVASQCSSSS